MEENCVDLLHETLQTWEDYEAWMFKVFVEDDVGVQMWMVSELSI